MSKWKVILISQLKAVFGNMKIKHLTLNRKRQPMPFFLFFKQQYLEGVKKKTMYPKWCHLNQVSKWGLIPSCSFNHPQKCTLNWSVRNFLVSTDEVLCHVGPTPYFSPCLPPLPCPQGGWSNLLDEAPCTSPQGKMSMLERVLSFLLLMTSHPTILPIKTCFV